MNSWFADGIKRTAGTAGMFLNQLLGSRWGHPLGILAYHRVSPRCPGVSEPTINVTPRRFHDQLVGLLRQGYRFRPLQEVLDAVRLGQALAPRTVVLTFDDGHASVCTRAWPILRNLGIPATVFLSTAYLDQTEPFPFDFWGWTHRQQLPGEAYRPLTVEQCREIARTGQIELGAHTHTHRNLGSEPEEFERDLRIGVERLRALFGVDRPTFSFPFGRRHQGHVSDELIAVCRRSGVSCALTTEAVAIDPHHDPYEWGRFTVYDWDTAATLAGKLAGWYGWAPRLQDRLSSFLLRRGRIDRSLRNSPPSADTERHGTDWPGAKAHPLQLPYPSSAAAEGRATLLRGEALAHCSEGVGGQA